jgi:6-pyruvoyltetrahydropterin/6-carboxytetrahydropterin synthase
LNEEVPFLRGVIPTTENLVIAFWQEIEPRLPAGRLHSIKLFETPRNFVEYRGPNPTF